MDMLIQVVSLGLLIVTLLTLVSILAFAIYVEFFGDARFSRSWDYLTLEEMHMIQEADEEHSAA
jgi:hypothetical protein